METNSLPNVLLVYQQADFPTSYADSESDPKIADQWYYEHDPNHLMGYDLSNSWGLNTDVHQKTFMQPVTSFSKPGTYTVRYRVQDQPPNSPYWNDPDAGRKWSAWSEMKVYVHRRPVTAFTASTGNPQVGQTVVFTDQSYDPDLQFTDPLGLKGIRNREWQYRVNNGSWVTVSEQASTRFELTVTESNATYEVALRVQDFLGAWSDWARYTFTAQNRPPMAYFQDPGYVAVNQPVTLYDGSWDLDGDAIAAWEWTVQNVDYQTVQHRITRVWFRGNSETNYDYGYLYGWTGSSWVEMARRSGSYDVAVDATSFGTITKLQLRLTTDRSILWSPTYTQAYQVQLDDGRLVNPGLYLSVSSHNANVWSGVWDAPVDQVKTVVENKYYTPDVTVSWPEVGTYRVKLKVQDAKGAWSSEFYRDITVNQPNNPPVARLSGPAVAYVDEPLTVSGASSYDPDPGDYIARAYWRYCKPGEGWTGYFTQNRGEAGFLAFTVTPDVIGDWQFELVVQDSRGAESAPAYLTVRVEEGFEIEGSLVPVPAERGRKIRVTAWAKRPSTGEKVQIDSMQAYIPHTTKPGGGQALKPGDSPHMANMTWNASSKTYTCEYLIPDRTVHGYWPDDGTYYVRVVGRKGTTEKEKLLTLTVQGHILDRTIIRTYRW